MIELIQTCSPNVHLPVAQAIIKSESNFNPYAIGVNKGGRAVKQPTSYQEAVKTAKRLIGQGLNIDMGYAQINSANLKWLGLSVEQVFNPCHNLKAMQTVYLTCYDKAGTTGLGTRMQRAFSCYNTGNMKKGFSNGYVNKTTNNFNYFVGKAKDGQSQAQLAQIHYQQYPNYQTVQYQSNYPVNYAQGLPVANPLPQVQIAQSVPISPNVGQLPQQGQVEQQAVQSAENKPANEPAKVTQFHSWDIFGDYGFVK